MTTLTLPKAAEYLHMHPVTLSVQAKAGIIPAAKVGGKWLFIESDLNDFIRSQYNNPRQTDSSHKNGGSNLCYLNEKVPKTGISNSALTDAQYTDLLAPTTKRKRSK